MLIRGLRRSLERKKLHSVGEVGRLARARDELEVFHGGADRHPERVHEGDPRERPARIRPAIGDGEEVVVRRDKDTARTRGARKKQPVVDVLRKVILTDFRQLDARGERPSTEHQ